MEIKYYVSNKGLNELKNSKDRLKKTVGYTLEPLEKIGEKLEKGHKIAFGIHSKLSEKYTLTSANWTEQVLFPVDFDNSSKNLEEVLTLLEPLGEPIFYYKTLSDNSFRLIYQYPLTYQTYVFEKNFGESDQAIEQRWERAKTFWLGLLEVIGDITGLAVGAVSKKENDFVIDTKIVNRHVATFGTDKTVIYNPNGFISRYAAAEIAKKSENKQQIKKQEYIKPIRTKGNKWTLSEVEARCQQLGIISDMRAWLGQFNSLILGVKNDFADITEDEAIQIFMANCDDGQGTEKQYQQMLSRFKPHQANITSFWGTENLAEKQKSKRDYFIEIMAEKAHKGQLHQAELNTLLECLNHKTEPLKSLTGLSMDYLINIIDEALENGFQFMRNSSQLGITHHTKESRKLKGKYLLNEDIAHMKELEGNILLQSFAGTGKTTTLTALFDEFILLVPTQNILKDQKTKGQEGITFVGGGNRFSPDRLLEAKKLIMTFDQYAKYITFMINNGLPIIETLIIDECHKLGDYTKIEAEKAHKLQKVHNAFQSNKHKRRIFMSATLYNMPNIFDYTFAYFTPQQRKMKLYQLEQRTHGVKANPSKEFFSAIFNGNLLNPDEKSLILCDKHISVNEMHKLKSEFERFKIKCDLITADNNNSDSQKVILKAKESDQLAEVVLASGVLNVGVDIQGLFNHIIILSDCPNFIEQAANRDRQAEYVSIISRNRQNSLKIAKTYWYTSPKGKVSELRTATKENPVSVKCPYTLRPYFIVTAENIKEYTEKQYKERIGLHNTFDILKTDNIYLTDLFYVQSEIWNNYVRDNMTTLTLHQHLKAIFINLDSKIVTLKTDFDEATQKTNNDTKFIADKKAVEQTFKYIQAKRKGETKQFRDFFQGYDDLKSTKEYKQAESLAKSIVNAKQITVYTSIHEASEQSSYKALADTFGEIGSYKAPKDSKGQPIQLNNTAVWDIFITKYNDLAATNYTTISTIISPFLEKDLSADEKKHMISEIKEIFSSDLTSKMTNKGVMNMLLSRGYSIDESRTAQERTTKITAQ